MKIISIKRKTRYWFVAFVDISIYLWNVKIWTIHRYKMRLLGHDWKLKVYSNMPLTNYSKFELI